MKKKQFFLIFSIYFTILSCNSGKLKTQSDVVNIDSNKEKMIIANKYLANQDAEIIEAYAKRRNWNLQQTQTGLWYDIYKKTKGDSIYANDYLLISYKAELLDGTVCYVVDSMQPVEIRMGKADVKQGLVEGLMYMCEGEKARIIIPQYLAFGLLGDQQKIPPRSTVIYDIFIQKILK